MLAKGSSMRDFANQWFDATIERKKWLRSRTCDSALSTRREIEGANSLVHACYENDIIIYDEMARLVTEKHASTVCLPLYSFLDESDAQAEYIVHTLEGNVVPDATVSLVEEAPFIVRKMLEAFVQKELWKLPDYLTLGSAWSLHVYRQNKELRIQKIQTMTDSGPAWSDYLTHPRVAAAYTRHLERLGAFVFQGETAKSLRAEVSPQA